MPQIAFLIYASSVYIIIYLFSHAFCITVPCYYKKKAGTYRESCQGQRSPTHLLCPLQTLYLS